MSFKEAADTPVSPQNAAASLYDPDNQKPAAGMQVNCNFNHYFILLNFLK